MKAELEIKDFPLFSPFGTGLAYGQRDWALSLSLWKFLSMVSAALASVLYLGAVVGLGPDCPVGLCGFLCDEFSVVGKKHFGVTVPELKRGLVSRPVHCQVVAGKGVAHDIWFPLQASHMKHPGKAFGFVGQREISA